MLITSQEENIVMFPSLTIRKETINEAMDILGDCLQSFAGRHNVRILINIINLL